MKQNMRQRLSLLITALSVILFIAAAAFMAAGLLYARQSTGEMGVSVLYARQSIPAGTVITPENAPVYIGVKRVPRDSLVPSAIILDGGSDITLPQALLRTLRPVAPELPESVSQVLNGLQTVAGISENVQLESKYFTRDSVAPEERLFGIPMDYKLAMAGEINVGDTVDIWVYVDSKEGEGEARKVYSGARVHKLKGENNEDIRQGDATHPVLAVFKLTEENITEVRRAQGGGTLFLVKHGVEGA